uniref:NADH-ubiquinone oxidoreductase chain 5 n=1 Tax=Trypetoptera punctulata TaxID=305554 RepID=A0A6B9RCM2_TRYPU|nr:NADH dehydrogenase subunit 5 [Trypetoptera punctulata]
MKNLSICSISFLSLSFMSLILFSVALKFLVSNTAVFLEWQITEIVSANIVFTLLFDWMSSLFMSFVLFISALVVFYSEEYMSNEKTINRFIFLVLLFVFSMMALIVSPNLISILLGWDGLGLISYCLVIYFQNVKSFNAGMITALSNRIGDVALLLAIAWMLNFGSWNFIFYLDFNGQDKDLQVIGLLVMLAAMTKSAQIPFSSWLPAAMAAPTPVSALVHSSTLVTAGVYLLIRFNVVITEGPLAKFLLLMSGLTMFMAGLGANFEFDLKKIIALSTLSQLGLMMSVLAAGFYKLAFFHLLTHALFKALLFLCAGAIIHNSSNFQDIRCMGGISKHMPLTVACLNVANLALCGMPFLAGFYSKDLILEMASMTPLNIFSYFLFFFSTGLTVAYSFRLVFITLTGDQASSSLHFLNDENSLMKWSMLGLMSMSIVGGSLLSWLLFPTPLVVVLPFYLKYMTLFVCTTGGLTGYFMSFPSLYNQGVSFAFQPQSNFSGSMWFMPYISTYGIVRYPLIMGSIVYKNFDQGWSEKMGGQELMKTLSSFSSWATLVHSNNLKLFLFTFVMWIFILLCFLVVSF